MSRDYKPSPERTKKSSKGNPFLTGLLVGILLGIAASLSVVMFIKGGDSPFGEQIEKEPKTPLADKIIADSKAKAAKAAAEKEKQTAADSNENGDDKTRFDFYTILPGSESKVSKEEENKIKATDQQPVVQKSYFLQVGAFQTDEEADNLKAKLALQGFEAVVQTATIPDKGIWHRVRVGPLSDLDQINKTKTDLISNGFNADLIKVNNENQ
ncbi:MAG: SPOR domain-containing protein [Methylotenera sp.]|uniref:SPOR domain-containing protein n=1 Tax=Methylotenera sp. TaxID=2051956 RepID=UPI002489801B|nr:SPOR domain-containing protein [Methylotenera sp.]MDI1308916.1 SPOR domain-containing protein [Methylotenera sp.]